MEKKLDLRIIKTYQALHNAFTQLLEQKSFEEITVNELCDTALIRRTTFYKHFADKYEYFAFYLKELRESFKSDISTDLAVNNPTDHLVLMARKMMTFIRSHQKLVNQLQKSNMVVFLHQELQLQFSEELRYAFITSKNRKSTPELELLISFYAGGLISIVYWWLRNQDTMDDDTVIAEIKKLISSIPILT